MQQAIVTVPKATLYESIHLQNHCLCGQQVSDELLSGWIVNIEDCQRNFFRVTTEYGYSGWLAIPDVQKLSHQKDCIWRKSQSPRILIQRLTDVLAAPKVQAPVRTTLFMGSHAIQCGPSENGWQKIMLANGSLGYIPAINAGSPPLVLNNKETGCVLPDNPNARSDLRSAILDYALSYLGVQYRWGGKTHEGIDCSGLTFMSYYMCGIQIFRDAAIQDGYPVKEIPLSRIKPADLLYFPGHVALYLGEGQYIHATGNMKSFGCVVNSLDPKAPDYRADLADSLYAAGSIFP
ncbi:MAG: C40 family peptidase [Lachnospiraceae bacterium]|nr:C40 family peptidase [Lachnospiraceae bacterium]